MRNRRLSLQQESSSRKLGRIEWIWNGVTTFMFQTFSVILHKQSVSLLPIVLSLFVQFIQILSLSTFFQEKLELSFRSQLGYNYWEYFALSFRLLPWTIRVGNYLIYQVIFYLCVTFVILCMVLFFIAYQRFHVSQDFSFAWAVGILTNSCPFIMTALYIPILEMLLSPMACHYIQNEFHNR